MPSLEQIIRPFVADINRLPPDYRPESLNTAPPQPVRKNIGIGMVPPSTLPTSVAPIVPPAPTPFGVGPSQQSIDIGQLPIGYHYNVSYKEKKLTSSYSIKQQYYVTGQVHEKTESQDGGAGSNGTNAQTQDAPSDNPTEFVPPLDPSGPDYQPTDDSGGLPPEENVGNDYGDPVSPPGGDGGTAIA